MSYAPEEDFSLCFNFSHFIFSSFPSRRHFCSVLLPVPAHRLPPALLSRLSLSVPGTGPGKSLRLGLLQTTQSILPISDSLSVQLLLAEASFALRRAGGQRSHGVSVGRPELQTEGGQSPRSTRSTRWGLLQSAAPS